MIEPVEVIKARNDEKVIDLMALALKNDLITAAELPDFAERIGRALELARVFRTPLNVMPPLEQVERVVIQQAPSQPIIVTETAARPFKGLRDPSAPAVPKEESITSDGAYIICLEDGHRCRSLDRYIAKFGMTADEYRAKWNLPPDYPMSAPQYKQSRQDIYRRSLGAEAQKRTAEPAKRTGTHG